MTTLTEVKAIKDFLDKWEQEATEWHIQQAEKMRAEEKDLRFQEMYLDKKHSGQYHYCLGEDDKRRLDSMTDEDITFEPYRQAMNLKQGYTVSYYRIRKAYLIEKYGALIMTTAIKDIPKEIHRERIHKEKMLISRVNKKIGDIIDASGLDIGVDCELNGIIIGTRGKVRVETITAGGYNVQCFHFRVLLKDVR